MRVLYFYQYFATPKGSWGTRVYEFARRWRKQGDRVTVVTSVYDKSDLHPTGLVTRFDVEGIDVIVINVELSNKHHRVRRLYTFVLYALLASWYALTVPADVVVSSSGPLTVGIPGLVARYLRRRPFVFEARDVWPEVAVQLDVLQNKPMIALARRFEALCYRAAARVVVLSEGMRQWICRKHPCAHLEVVPNASDNAFFTEKRLGTVLPAWVEGRKLALFTGTVGVANDCWQLVRLAERLREHGDAEVLIVIIGDGKERAAIEAYVEEAGLDNLRFVDTMPKEDLVAWLQAACCSLLVLRPLPILDTSSPNKLFDALAAGIPVVQTTQGWIKTLLEEEECGLTVSSDDPDAMRAAVLRLARDEAFRQRLADNARRVALAQFDRDLLARKMRDILRTVIEKA